MLHWKYAGVTAAFLSTLGENSRCIAPDQKSHSKFTSHSDQSKFSALLTTEGMFSMYVPFVFFPKAGRPLQPTRSFHNIYIAPIPIIRLIISQICDEFDFHCVYGGIIMGCCVIFLINWNYLEMGVDKFLKRRFYFYYFFIVTSWKIVCVCALQASTVMWHYTIFMCVFEFYVVIALILWNVSCIHHAYSVGCRFM